MEAKKVIQEARKSGEEVEDGLIWHTYALEDVIVQIPREDDQWRIKRIESIYDQLDSEVPKPEILDIKNEIKYSGVVFEKIEGEMFRNLGKRLKNQSEDTKEYKDLRNRYLNAVENAGEALALIHSSKTKGEGFGYFKQRENAIEAPYETWENYIKDKLEELEDIPEIFEKAAQIGFNNFNIDKVPENSGRSILHQDFNSGNLMIQKEGEVTVFDYDNSIYGDPDFGFVNSMFELCDYDDKKALERFRNGYKSVRNLEMSQEVEENYVALALIDSVEAGKWIHENRDVDFIEEFAEDVNSWAESYFE